MIRFFHVTRRYTAGEPAGAISAYMEWILGDGQVTVSELGFVPLN